LGKLLLATASDGQSTDRDIDHRLLLINFRRRNERAFACDESKQHETCDHFLLLHE
jgi:hypothetical protein